ncbi:MAG: hypothetical protein JWM29_1053, partial [Solirubrobacterales bacterium]|nr:hypothetical protein [Solirubrobacterales bacterium]
AVGVGRLEKEGGERSCSAADDHVANDLTPPVNRSRPSVSLPFQPARADTQP